MYDGMGGFAQWGKRRDQDSRLATESLSRKMTLEQLAAAAQEREFKAQLHPGELETQSLGNQTTKAELGGKQAASDLASLNTEAAQKYGSDNMVRDKKQEARAKAMEIMTTQSEALGQMAARVKAMPGLAQGSYIAEQFTRMGMPEAFTKGLMQVPAQNRAEILEKMSHEGVKNTKSVQGQLAVNKAASADGIARDTSKIKEQYRADRALQEAGLDAKQANALELLTKEYNLKKELERLKGAIKSKEPGKLAKSMEELQAKLFQNIAKDRSMSKEEQLAKVNSTIDYADTIKAGITSSMNGDDTRISMAPPGDDTRRKLGADTDTMVGKKFSVSGKDYTYKEIREKIIEANPDASEEKINAHIKTLIK